MFRGGGGPAGTPGSATRALVSPPQPHPRDRAARSRSTRSAQHARRRNDKSKPASTARLDRRTVPEVFPDDLVERLGDKQSRLEAIRALMGGVNAREVRRTVMTEEVFEALVRGTRHGNDVVRWWSVQLLDHSPDKRAFDAIVPLLEDPVDRVRRNAVHALGCRVCKPDATATPDSTVVRRIRSMASDDPNDKVRLEASATLVALDK